MSILTQDELNTLYQEREGVCISIYRPTHPKVAETAKGRIQLKNLLAAELRVSDVQKLLIGSGCEKASNDPF